jgi:hypothetical protein
MHQQPTAERNPRSDQAGGATHAREQLLDLAERYPAHGRAH